VSGLKEEGFKDVEWMRCRIEEGYTGFEAGFGRAMLYQEHTRGD